MDPNVGNWLGVACLAITGILAWLTRRDQLRNDVRVALLEKSDKDCQEKHATLQKEHAEIKQELVACHEQHLSTDKRLNKLESNPPGSSTKLPKPR